MKKQKKSPTSMGRPRIPLITPDLADLEGKLKAKPINIDEVIYWMNLNATCEEISGSFYVSVATLVRRLKEEFGMTFDELKKRCCGSAKLALRRNQFKMSEHNASMAIWLGKNWLGQKDDPISTTAFNGKLAKLFDDLKDPLEYSDKAINEDNRVSEQEAD